MPTFKVNTLTLVPTYREVCIEAPDADLARARARWLSENCRNWWNSDCRQDWENSGRVAFEVEQMRALNNGDYETDIEAMEASEMSLREGMEYMRVVANENDGPTSEDHEITALRQAAKELRAIRDRFGFRNEVPEDATVRLSNLLKYLDEITDFA